MKKGEGCSSGKQEKNEILRQNPFVSVKQSIRVCSLPLIALPLLFSQLWKGQFPPHCRFCCYSNNSLCWLAVVSDIHSCLFLSDIGSSQIEIT